MYSVTNELNTEDCDFDIPAGMRPQIKYCLVLPCLAWPKLAFLAGNTFCSRAIVHLRKLQLETDGSTGDLIDPKPAQFFFAQIESSR